ALGLRAIDAQREPGASANDPGEEPQLVDRSRELAFQALSRQRRLGHGAPDQLVAHVAHTREVVRDGFEQARTLLEGSFAKRVEREGGERAGSIDVLDARAME